MKELSIEEKARRYDEAIERGSRLWESDTITRESYEYIFPELKESENEKIRKELLNAFQKSEDSIYMSLTPYKRKSFIDWLEKQGAELSVYQNVLFKIATILSQHEDKEDSPLEQIRSIVVDGLVSAMDIDKQGEQKPEEIVNLHDYLYGEQKPAWSEDDEIALGDALWCCKQAASIAKDENDMGNAWYAETWLKDLKDRYTWKPSDEQIKVLEFFIPYVTKCSVVLQKSKDTLLSLLSDLKKLKE